MQTSINDTANTNLSHTLAGLGALGIAMQNYQAVDLFLLNILRASGRCNSGLLIASHVFAAITGGLCSGVVNYWMNDELLQDFFKRFSASNNDSQEASTESITANLTFWQKLQYYIGLAAFITTGLLFGLMAFTFAEAGPLGLLSIGVGLFVSAIMTIQEVETWLGSYQQTSSSHQGSLTTQQKLGKWLGHLIAFGNVFALSLLFTLSLMQSLLLVGVAAPLAFTIGASIAFTFGAFTEFYFYNVYLADFCQNLADNISKMATVNHFWLGMLSILTNAFVNAALTYSGIDILATLLITSGIFTPTLPLIIATGVISAVFAGSASAVLGIDFWVKQNSHKEAAPAQAKQNVSFATHSSGLFATKKATPPSNQEEEEINLIQQGYSFSC
jgi:F0F1-type ATP synthase assembly protein I